MAPKLLLLADDHEDNRIVACALLTHYGHGVILAGNGVEAVAQAKRHLPDLILMDLSMPEMDGWQATRLLKAGPTTAGIPIVAVTAGEATEASLHAAGFCALLRKPFVGEDLRRAVEVCLAGVERGTWIDLPPRTLPPPTV